MVLGIANNLGGCAYVGQQNMQQILQDCLRLAEVGQALADDWKTRVPEARRLLDDFFKPWNDQDADSIKRMLLTPECSGSGG